MEVTREQFARIEHCLPLCLREVVRSLRSEVDAQGQAVCQALAAQGATPARLQHLKQEALVQVLKQAANSAGTLWLKEQALRWLPPHVQGRIINRRAESKVARSAVRAYLTQVLRHS